MLSLSDFKSIARRAVYQEMWGVFEIGAQAGVPLSPIGEDATPILLPTETVFWADPFYVSGDVILVEQMDFDVGYGRIMAVSIEEPDNAKPVLDDGIHTSYPCVVRSNQETYVVPERSANRRLEIYKWDHERSELELAHVTLEGVGINDPTIFYDDDLGHWVLFMLDDAADIVSVLRLFLAVSLDGPWQEHAASPINVGPRGARPAGVPFREDGRLIRPAQDCSETYGGGLIFFEIDELTVETFSERECSSVRSGVRGFEAGVHTFSRSPSGDRTMIDAKCHRSVLSDRALVTYKASRVAARFRRRR